MSAPLLQQTLPADNLSGVSVTASLFLTFNQIVTLGTSGTIRIYTSDGTLIHTISVTDSSQVWLEQTSRPEKVIVNPNVNLLPGTGYYVLIDAGAIENRYGEDFAGISSPTAFNFTTAGTPPGGGDTTAPTLTSTSPLDDAAGVAVGSNLVLTFNESVQAGSGNIEIRKVSDNSVVKTIAVTDGTQVGFSGNQLTINPTTDLAAGTEYYVSMASGVVRDLANNNFAGISSSTTFNFTTASPPSDTTAPLLVSTTPGDNATGVQPFANLVLTFDEAVKAGTGNIEIRKTSDGSVAMSIPITDAVQVSFSGNQLTVNPIGSFASETSYYVTMASGAVLDSANNAFAGISSPTAFDFTIRESTPPVLTDTSPDPHSTGVAVGANIVLTFSEAVKAGTGNIVIKNVDDDSIVQSIAITDASQVTFSGNQVTINPASDLAESGRYYVMIASGVIRDLANNAFAGLQSYWDLPFATIDPTAPTLLSTAPTDNATGVAAGANLVLTFSEYVKPGSGNIEIHNASDGSVAMIFGVTDWTQVDISGKQLTINPGTDLTQGASYYVTMSSGVVLDWANNAYAGISSPSAFNFTILPDTIVPLLTESTPADGATDVSTQSDLVLTFSEDVKAGSGNVEIRKSSDGSLVQSIAITDASKVGFSNNQIMINPSDLNAGVSYYVTLGSGVIRDLANNAFAGISTPTALNFSTVPYSIVGTPGIDNLVGADNRNDSFDGLPSVDTLTGGTGDDIYYIKNYEGGQTSFLTYSEDFQDVTSVLPEADLLDLSLDDLGGDDQIDRINLWYFGDPFSSFSFIAPNGTNLTVGGTYEYGPAGTFTIVAMEIDDTDPENPILTSLSITYEIDTDYQPKYIGRVNYNYAPAGAAALDTIVENPGGGNDTVVAYIDYTLPGNVEKLTLGGYNSLDGTGNSLDNVITGNWGHNVLDGKGGADTMAGLFGNDTYVVDNPGDSIVEAGFWDGTDTVLSSVTYSLSAYVDNLTLTGSGNINGSGNELNNELRGNAGINVLTGADGNDTYFVGTGDSVVESLDAGHDRVESSVTHTLSDNVEDLTLIGNGNINGTGNGLDNVLIGTNKLPGTGGQNVLTGGAGNDTLDGKTGVDMLAGGLGDDLYIIDNYEGGQNSILLQSDPQEYIGMGWNISFLTDPTNFSITAWDGTGDGIVDAIRLHYYDFQAQPYYHSWYLEFSTTQLGTNLVPGTYTDIERFAFADPGHPGMDIYGDGRGHSWQTGSFTVTQLVFNYSGGSPVLTSLSISFEQRSGPGEPALYGVINYNYSPAGAAVLDTVVENAAQGTDTVLASVSYTLGANLENLTLDRADHINGTGNSLDNVITGNPGNNVLDGKAGADTMVGGSGGDTFVVDNVGDIVVEEFDLYDPIYGNFDTVQSSITYVLPTEVEALKLTGSANINGTGNDLDNTITGNIGNNVLNGGLGDDTLLGFGGNDTFDILAGAGSDTIEDFSGGVGAGDVVVLDGFALGTFSAVHAAMTQNGANTVLNLGNGETLTFLNVLKSAFAANDFTFVNVQGPPPPPPGPEPFTLPISGAFTNAINGTRRADNLTGSSANNKIDGKQGNDTMTGLAGDDTYLVDAAGDNVVETSGNGIDTVISSASSYTLANNVENLTLTGTNNHTATGNGLDNLIIASASRPDIINGGAGNDILRAGTGACVLTGGTGSDIFDFDARGSQKQITDFTVGEDLVDLRTLLAWYGGSDPLAANAISLSAVAGGVLVSVKASAGGALQGLVKITGVSVGDLDVGNDILWDA